MMDRYRKANQALHPTPRALDRALTAAHGVSPPRRTPRVLLPAALAAVVAALLLFSWIPIPVNPPDSLAALSTSTPTLGPSNPTIYPTGGVVRTLAAPVYPDLPDLPGVPQDDNRQAWNTYNLEYQTYSAAWQAFRSSATSLPQTPGLLPALEDFTAQTVALSITGGENQIYSPISLWLALAMLSETTGGETRAQLLAALGAEDMEQLRGWVDSLWHALYIDDGASSLLLSNSIWLDQSLTCHQEVLNLLAQTHHAGSYQVSMGTQEANTALSQWVAQQSRGLIGDDTPVAQTETSTMAVLASVLYYQAGWLSKFRPEETSIDRFTASDGTVSTVEFMHTSQDSSFLRRDGYQAAALATSQGEMVFVLPEEGVDPASLLSDPRFLSSLDFSGPDAFDGKIQWSIPKFDLSADLDLQSTLETLKLSSVCDPDCADFSPLSDSQLYLDKAKQMTRVKIDENGVEGGAVTLLTIKTTAGQANPAICVMDLDRPFLFLVRSGSGIVLFAGIVDQP